MLIKEEFKDYFRDLSWPELVVEDEKIYVPSGTILENDGSGYVLNFFWRNQKDSKYEEKNRPTIIFGENFDIREILYLTNFSYDISYYGLFKDIFDISDKIKKIIIDENHIGISRDQGVVKISPDKLLEIYSEIIDAHKSIRSHENSIATYYKNKIHNKHFVTQIKDVTTVKPGAFKFLVDRFNLNTKKSKKDYLKYLSSNDIESLQVFTERLIKNNVFSEEYLRILDDYFIKEKLRNIIEVGKEILALKTTNLNTIEAKKVVKSATSDSRVKQLETLWQRYFEKNLLYLIFSYKKIYPKIELVDIEGDKKYPDFMGVNHYNGIDVIEIKTHLTNILSWDPSHKNFSFSSEMSKAIIQTMNYLDAIVQRRFQNDSDKTKITQFTDEENLYHPRGIIVISSTSKLTKTRLTKSNKDKLNRDFTKLRNSLNNIEILTFDEVLQIADDYIKNIRSKEG